MKTKKILLLLLSCTLSLGIIGCGDYIVNQQPSNLGTSESKQDNNDDDINGKRENLIFDVKKLYKAKKEDVDNLLGEIGEQDENEPYVYNYTNHGGTDIVTDDEGYCINLFLDVKDKNYKINDRGKILKQYGLDLKGSSYYETAGNYHYTDVNGNFDIDIWIDNLDNDKNIETLSFFPEGFKTVADFLEKKSLEHQKKKSSSKKDLSDMKYQYFVYSNYNNGFMLRGELADIRKEEVQDVINELYAIKGYKFKEEPYVSKFSNKNLYSGTIENMDDVPFTVAEKNLLKTLSNMRNE